MRKTAQEFHVIINESSTVTCLAIKNIIATVSSQSHFYIELNDIHDLIKKVEDVSANLLITDLSCCAGQDESKIRLLLQLCYNNPQLRVMVYSSPLRGEAMSRLCQLGQVSFISRLSSLKEFEQAVATIMAGGKYVSSLITQPGNINVQKIFEKLDLLTSCEKDVVAHLLRGESLSDISSLFQRSIKTISAHKCNAMRKLDAKNVADLFLIKNDFFMKLEGRRIV